MPIKARSSNGRAIRDAETIEQDERAYELWVGRLSVREIARELGIPKSTAEHAIKRGRALHRSPEIEQIKQDELAELDWSSRQLKAIALSDQPMVDHGHVIFLPNLSDPSQRKVLVDQRIKMQAHRELRANAARRSALLGLDAPQQVRVTTVTEDEVDAEIRRLEAKLSQNDPKESVEP